MPHFGHGRGSVARMRLFRIEVEEVEGCCSGWVVRGYFFVRVLVAMGIFSCNVVKEKKSWKVLVAMVIFYNKL